jgi:hypothetical protein
MCTLIIKNYRRLKIRHKNTGGDGHPECSVSNPQLFGFWEFQFLEEIFQDSRRAAQTKV